MCIYKVVWSTDYCVTYSHWSGWR